MPSRCSGAEDICRNGETGKKEGHKCADGRAALDDTGFTLKGNNTQTKGST
jgi:hypothetical protein